VAEQRLPHEGGNHHPVLAGLSRTHGVEETHEDGGELLLLPVGKRQELVDGLRTGVAPAPDVGRPEDEVVALRIRHLLALPVHLGGGCHEDLLPLLVGDVEDRSVPLTLVSIVRTGLSTIRRTPTEAARWKTTSQGSITSARRGWLKMVSMT